MNCVVCIQKIGQTCVRCPKCRQSVFCDAECYKIGKSMHRPICKLVRDPAASVKQQPVLQRLLKMLIKTEPVRYVADIIQANSMLSATCIVFSVDASVTKVKHMSRAKITSMSLIESRDFALSIGHAGLAIELERLNYAREMIFLFVDQENNIAFAPVVCREFMEQKVMTESIGLHEVSARGVRSSEAIKAFTERVLLIAEQSVIFNVHDQLWHFAKAAALITIDADMAELSDNEILLGIDNCYTQYLRSSLTGRKVYFMKNKGIESYALISVEFITALSFAVEHGLESCSSAIMVECPFFVIGEDHVKRKLHSFTYSTYNKDQTVFKI